MRRKQIGKNLDELERNHSKKKTYYDYDDDVEYGRIKEIKDLFDLSIDEDYFKLIIAKGSFNNKYIQYESKRDKKNINS